MSTEEEIVNEEPQCTDILSPDPSNPTRPTKLNKNGKPRKILSPEALEKLKLAREKANAIRKESYTKKLEEKVEKLKAPKEVPSCNPIAEEIPSSDLIQEEKKVKPKGKKKTKIIVEQSSDDSDEFEPNDNVVFVKRVSRKKKDIPVPELPDVITPAINVDTLHQPEPPTRPPPRQLTPQELALKNQYNNMFSGGFINNNPIRRQYY